MQLVERVGAWLGRPIAPTVPWHYSTPHALAKHLMPVVVPENAPLSCEVSQLSEEEAEMMLLAELEGLPKTHA
jgi:hypothetical protein